MHIWICRRDSDEVEEKMLIYKGEGERERGKTKVKREEGKER